VCYIYYIIIRCIYTDCLYWIKVSIINIQILKLNFYIDIVIPC